MQCVSETSCTVYKVFFMSKATHEYAKNALMLFLHQPTTAFNPFILSPTHTCPFVCLHPFAVQQHLWWHHDTVPLRTLSLGHCGSLQVWNPTHLKERAFLRSFVSRHSSHRLLLPPQRRFCWIIIPLISVVIECSDLICFMYLFKAGKLII